MPEGFAEGWIDDKEAREKLQSEMIASGQLERVKDIPLVASSGRDSFLWQVDNDTSRYMVLPWNQSSIGSCVAHGFGRAFDDRLRWQILQGSRESFPADGICRESLYGLSRVQVGGMRPGAGDGSTGAWAAKALLTYGTVRYRKYPPLDLSDGYSVNRCRSFGNTGSPLSLRSYEAEHKATSISLVKSAAEAATLLRQGIPIAVCSNRGFTMKRSPGGYCEPSGSWAHCMAIRGVFKGRNGQDDFVICNSWGDYLGSDHSTLKADSNVPTELPAGHFAARGDVVDSMLRQGDSYSINKVVGYARKWWPWG